MQGNRLTIHGYVSGRVQGVFFRAETRRQAEELNLQGWVKNLPDGRVEFLLSGERTPVEEMLQWLRNGPRLARVDALDTSQIDELSAEESVHPQALNGFTILS